MVVRRRRVGRIHLMVRRRGVWVWMVVAKGGWRIFGCLGLGEGLLLGCAADAGEWLSAAVVAGRGRLVTSVLHCNAHCNGGVGSGCGRMGGRHVIQIHQIWAERRMIGGGRQRGRVRILFGTVATFHQVGAITARYTDQRGIRCGQCVGDGVRGDRIYAGQQIGWGRTGRETVELR